MYKLNYLLFISLIVLLYSFTINGQEIEKPDDGQLLDLFNHWISELEVEISPDEFESKFKIFKENLENTVKFNQENVEYNILNLTDTTDESINNLQGRDINEASPTFTSTFPTNNVVQQGLNAFSHIPNAEFLSMFTGATVETTVIAAAAAGLSVGAIVGIAVGGTVAVGAAVGGTIAVVKYKKNKSKEQQYQPETPKPVEMKSKGMDMFNFDPKTSHQSITARAAPMN
eukprot:gene3764-4686_t